MMKCVHVPKFSQLSVLSGILRPVQSKKSPNSWSGPFSNPCSVQKRFSSEWSPKILVNKAEDLFNLVHEQTHLPWWIVIGATTLTLRAVITLPIAVYQHRVIAKTELLMPSIMALQGDLKLRVMAQCKAANLSLEEANRKLMLEAAKLTKELLVSNGCQSYKRTILPLAQIPLWITLSFSLRNLSGAIPGWPATDPDVALTFHNEGILWFKDLTEIDAYYILPLILVTSNILNIEMHVLQRQGHSKIGNLITNTMRVLTVFMATIAIEAPTVIVLYWALSSSYGLAQNVVLRYPKVRRALNIPKSKSESRTPFKDMLVLLKEKLKAFVQSQRNISKQ